MIKSGQLKTLSLIKRLD